MARACARHQAVGVASPTCSPGSPHVTSMRGAATAVALTRLAGGYVCGCSTDGGGAVCVLALRRPFGRQCARTVRATCARLPFRPSSRNRSAQALCFSLLAGACAGAREGQGG